MTTQTLFTFPSPTKAGDTRTLGNLLGSSLALAVAEFALEARPILLVVPDNQTALKLHNEISQFSSLPCQLFSDWETLPYDNFSPHQEIISNRIACLYQLPQQPQGILITSVTTLMQRVVGCNSSPDRARIRPPARRQRFDRCAIRGRPGTSGTRGIALPEP